MRQFVAVLLAWSTLHSIAVAQAPDGLARVLALPVSVGSVAMLVRHAAQPDAQRRLGEAIRHSDPDVRAVAARVVLVTGSLDLLIPVRAQLDRETDPIAAAEQLRAVATFSNGTSDAALVALAVRLGADSADVLAEVLARIRPASAAAYAPRLAAVTVSASIAGALIMASVREPALAPSLAMASLIAGRATWAVFIDGRHARNLPVDGAALKEGLRAEDYRIRRETLRYVAMVVGHEGDQIDPEVVRSIADGAEKMVAPDTWESALVALIRRSTARKARAIDWQTLIVDPPEQSQALFRDINGSLLGRERSRVEKLLGRKLFGDETYKSQQSRIRQESWQQLTRTAPAFAGGLFGDLVRLTSCEPGDRAFAAAEIGYRADGRPRSITPADLPLSDGCREAAAVVFSLVVAPVRFVDVPGASDGLVFPFSPRFIACTQLRPERLRYPIREPGVVVPPRIKTLPEARYPDRLRMQGIQGVVGVALEVSSSGCVRSVETERSLHPALDLEAIQTALSADILPMTIDNRPAAIGLSMGIRFGRSR